MVMKVKAKGSNAERELVHRFWKSGWAACRIAGSGSISLPAPDIYAGSPARSLVIECKVTASKTQYFTNQEIDDLQHFASRCNAEPWVAVKFNRDAWYFTPIAALEETSAGKKFAQEKAKMLAFSFQDLLDHQP